MDPVTREDVGNLHRRLDDLVHEIGQLNASVREEMGRCTACRPVVNSLHHCMRVDCGIRSNGSARGLVSIVESHEETFQAARRNVRWAIASFVTWVGTALAGIGALAWEYFRG